MLIVFVAFPTLDSSYMKLCIGYSPYELVFGQKPCTVEAEGISVVNEEEDGIIFEDIGVRRFVLWCMHGSYKCD